MAKGKQNDEQLEMLVSKWRELWHCLFFWTTWRFDDLLFRVGRVTQAEPLSKGIDAILGQKMADQAIRDRKAMIVNAGERLGKEQ